MVASGAGICTTATSPTFTVVVTSLNAAGIQSATASMNLFTTANGAIKSCWNPSGAAAATVSPAIAAGYAILACYVIYIFLSKEMFFR